MRCSFRTSSLLQILTLRWTSTRKVVTCVSGKMRLKTIMAAEMFLFVFLTSGLRHLMLEIHLNLLNCLRTHAWRVIFAYCDFSSSLGQIMLYAFTVTKESRAPHIIFIYHCFPWVICTKRSNDHLILYFSDSITLQLSSRAIVCFV